MPVIDQAEGRLQGARDALALATENQNRTASVLSAARAKVAAVLSALATQTELLAKAQAELAPAVLAGADHDEVRRRAQDAQTKIDALNSTHAILTKEVERLDKELQRHHGPVGDAQRTLQETELHALLARYAKLIAPAIPLALEIRQRTNQWLDTNSSCLLNPRNRLIGKNFKVDDDGSVFFQLG